MNVRIPAVRLGLLPAGIALALAPSFASAQDAAAGGTTDLDRVVGLASTGSPRGPQGLVCPSGQTLVTLRPHLVRRSTMSPVPPLPRAPAWPLS